MEYCQNPLIRIDPTVMIDSKFGKQESGESQTNGNFIRDSNDFTFTEFLISQKDYLNRELKTNKEYFFTNYAFTNINGRIMDVDKNEYIKKAIPLPGIDYKNPIYRSMGVK